MKTRAAVFLAFLFLFASAACAQGSFDASVFQNNPDYDVTSSDGGMNVMTESLFLGWMEDGGSVNMLIFKPAVLILNNDSVPPCLQFYFLYQSGAAIEPTQVEITTDRSRYSFILIAGTVANPTEDGNVSEGFSVALTDQSDQLLREIVDGNLSSVSVSLSGNRSVSGTMLFSDDNRATLSRLYDDYVRAGGLNGDFTLAHLVFPCSVQSTGNAGSAGASSASGTGSQWAGSSGAGSQSAGALSSATTGETNALKSAQSYLSFMAFSHSGLIDQLEYEGYTTSEATYAADHCGADWNEQAVKSAANYLEYSAFSRSGLIDQLEYEGFTASEATYAVDRCGANWNEQAAKSAANYLKYSSFSRSELIDQLEFEGFTYDQAVYGVGQNGY